MIEAIANLALFCIGLAGLLLGTFLLVIAAGVVVAQISLLRIRLRGKGR